MLAGIKNHFEDQPLQDPVTIQLPKDGSRAVAELEIYDGLSCSACRFLTTSRDVLSAHWRQNASHSGYAPRYSEVKMQSWSTGRYARYWIVRLAAESGIKVEASDTQSVMESIIAESTAQLKAEDEEKLQHGDMQEGIDHDSTWVKEMKWVRHIGSRNLAEIHAAAQYMPSKGAGICAQGTESIESLDELRACQFLKESFDREVDRCSWRLDSVPKETLQCLHGIEVGKPHSKPFGFTAQDDSHSRYKMMGYRYLSCCWRAHRMGREAAGTRLGIYFTDQQWSLMSKRAEEVDEVGRGGTADARS